MKWKKQFGLFLLAGFTLIACNKCNRVKNSLPDKPTKTTESSSQSVSKGCEGSKQPFHNIDSGINSGIREDHNQVIDNRDDWLKIWNKLKGSNDELPDVDFNKSVVIAAFRGEQPNGGYTLSVDRVCLHQDKYFVRITNKEPKKGCPVPEMVSRPYHLVKIDKNNSTIDDIRFKENTTLHCPSKEGGTIIKCPTPIQFSPFKKGKRSGFKTADNKVIRSDQEWKRLSDGMKPDNLPRVDFNRNMVIAVFQGKQNTGGYDINVERVCKAGKNLTISVKKVKPGEKCIVTQAITSPYELVVLPKIEGDVRFESETKVKRCD